jgi:hypothetical protein
VFEAQNKSKREAAENPSAPAAQSAEPALAHTGERISFQLFTQPTAADSPSEREADAAASFVTQEHSGGAGAADAGAAPSSLDGGGGAPPSPPPGPTAAFGVIVEDDSPLSPGQMGRTQFIETMSAEIKRAADEELATTGRTARDCPYLNHWLRFYRDSSAEHIERAIQRYAPPERADLISLREAVVARVRSAVRAWIRSGGREVQTPDGVAWLGKDDGLTQSSGDGAEIRSKAIDGAGAAPSAGDPATVREQLRNGRPLDSAVRARMERGFGRSFGGVRLHTDDNVGRLAGAYSARAFTIGNDIAFGAGQYRPGTLAGDMLIAHELAHAVQQEGGAGDAGPQNKAQNTRQLETNYQFAAEPQQQIPISPGTIGPGTIESDTLIAHDVAHIVRPARAGDVSDRDETDANRAAVSAVAGQRGPALALTNLRLARCGLNEPQPSVHQLGVEEIPPIADHEPPPAISSLSQFTPPAGAPESLGERLESEDDAVRRSAIAEMGIGHGEELWRRVLIASAGHWMDVRLAAEQLVAQWIRSDPAFVAWLTALPTSGQGQLGDYAVRLIMQGGLQTRFDLEAYRGILRQELALARSYRGEMMGARAGQSTTVADTSFAELEAGLGAESAIQLSYTGRRISRLLERFTLLRTELARIDAIGAQSTAQSGPIADLLRTQRQMLLDAAFWMTPGEYDVAFRDALRHMRDLPVGLARHTLTQLSTHVEAARDALRPMMSSGAAAGSPERRLADLATSLSPELDALSARIRAWNAAVEAHPIAVMQDIDQIRPSLDSLLARTRLTRMAISAGDAASQLERQVPHTSAPPLPSIDSPYSSDQALQGLVNDQANITWQQEIVIDLRRHRDNFALLAELYQQSPETVSRLAETETETFRTTGSRMEAWASTQDALNRMDLLQLQISLGLAVLIVSAWTGGVAGEAVAGGIEVLGGSGEMIWLGSVLAEGSAFYFTQRGLDWALHGGEGPFLPQHWGRDLALSIGAVGALRVAGGMFDALAGARPPTTGLAVGRFATSYATLLAYSSVVEPIVRGEEIQGITTGRFWAQAGETLLAMGALHVGLAAMRPLTLRITQPILNARIVAHNARSERLGADLEASFQGEADASRTQAIVRRSRALLQERIRLLREIAARDPAQLTQVELTRLEGLIETQIRLADSTLLLDQFRVRPLSIGANTFGYEGSFETVRAHFVQRGFTVRAEDPTNGLLRLVDPNGHEMTLLRLHAGAAGADPLRLPPELDLFASRGEAEVERRAALTYDTIRELQDDVPRVAQSTGIPERVIRAVREHLFFRLYDLAIGPGRTSRQRFDPLYRIGRYWMRAYENQLTASELLEFRRLLAHEYVEQALMAAGMPYRSAHPGGWRGATSHGTRQHFGAHEISPSESLERDPFAGHEGFGLSVDPGARPAQGEVWDYDAAVRSAFEALRSRTDSPYRVIADPSAPNGYRIEAIDPAELGSSSTTRGGARTTGADPAWGAARAAFERKGGLSPTEAMSLADLLRASGRDPASVTPLYALTSDQLRQLLTLDASALTSVLAIDPGLLPSALSLTASTSDTLGGHALVSLLQGFGRPTLEEILSEPVVTTGGTTQPSRNQRQLAGQGRNVIAAEAEGTTTEASGADALVIDNNAWASLQLLMTGTPWSSLQDGQRLAINTLRRQAGLAALTADPPDRSLRSLLGSTRLLLPATALAESRSGGPGAVRRRLLTTEARDSAAYTELLGLLRNAPVPTGPAAGSSTGTVEVGGPRGSRDRAVVADMLFAAGTPVRFVTFDASVYERLYGWNISPVDSGEPARRPGEGLSAFITRAHRSTQSFRIRISLPSAGRTVEATIYPANLW